MGEPTTSPNSLMQKLNNDGWVVGVLIIELCLGDWSLAPNGSGDGRDHQTGQNNYRG